MNMDSQKKRIKQNDCTKVFWLLLVGIMSFSFQSFAQTNDLKINDVFRLYGKQKGATMVEMKNEALEGYDFNYFKSLTIENNQTAIDFALICLKKDQKGAKKIKEVYSDGKPVTIYLQLPPKGKQHRLILFNETKSGSISKMTLIYMESEREDILNLILHKK